MTTYRRSSTRKNCFADRCIGNAIAEFKRSLISERVRSGIAKARAQGKRHGRPKINPDTIKEIKGLRKQGKSLNQITKQLGMSHQTVANYS